MILEKILKLQEAFSIYAYAYWAVIITVKEH